MVESRVNSSQARETVGLELLTYFTRKTIVSSTIQASNVPTMASISSTSRGVCGSVWPKLQAPKLPQNFHLTPGLPFRLPHTNFISSTNFLTPSSHPFPS
ncbi:uncharacterized protein CLUP02_07994 [Colletotrichum lupini]|uniref:Uncharacterized protein n=1 Tax=Colletotrichum lupini TaxID=145971 RepID=A0A9Q8WGL4_9PEZI|nr:uncharacterized protein CLUP02_07994 [Colletotrichum lupini]UQC82506.1 hypothetical protein CLUP02_07994 [Colletotrichum lupini]